MPVKIPSKQLVQVTLTAFFNARFEEHSGTSNDKENFKLLLDEVRSKLDELGQQTGRFYGLTAALPW